jgi:hypothetical protein
VIAVIKLHTRLGGNRLQKVMEWPTATGVLQELTTCRPPFFGKSATRADCKLGATRNDHDAVRDIRNANLRFDWKFSVQIFPNKKV